MDDNKKARLIAVTKTKGNNVEIEYCCLDCGLHGTAVVEDAVASYSGDTFFSRKDTTDNQNQFTCPNCGDAVIIQKEGIYHPTHQRVLHITHKIESDETSIHVRHMMYKIDKQKYAELGKRLIVECIEKRDIEISLVPTFTANLILNGEDMKPTKTNLRKMLTHVEQSAFQGTIFYQLSVQMEKHSAGSGYSMANAVLFFKDNIWFEKIYQEDNQLLFYANFVEKEHSKRPDCRHLLHTDKKKPHQILGLTRPLYKQYMASHMQSAFQYNGLYFCELCRLVDRYGAEKTEDILHMLLTEYRKRNRSQHRLLALFLDDTIQFDIYAMYQYLSDKIWTYQGIDDAAAGAGTLQDYIHMCQQMNIPYDLYPRSLKMTHDITLKNFNMILQQEQAKKCAEQFQTQKYQSLEWMPANENFVVLVPKTAEDILKEGASLCHCVGSYIPQIGAGNSKIVFMRYKETPDKSLVTLDIRDNSLYQAAGFGNRQLTKEECVFVKKWIKALGLTGCI